MKIMGLHRRWQCLEPYPYLEVETDTWQVHKRLDTSLAELLGVTDTGALENEWGAESATGDDDLLAGLDDLGLLLSWSKGLRRHSLDSDCFVALQDDLEENIRRSS
jgi:hypothetical protein